MSSIKRYILCLVALMFVLCGEIVAQNSETGVPEVFYSAPKKYVIAGVDIVQEGGTQYDDFEKQYIINSLGLGIGNVVKIPGDEITRAIRRLYNQKSFSGATILLSRVINDSAYLTIQLQPAHQL